MDRVCIKNGRVVLKDRILNGASVELIGSKITRAGRWRVNRKDALVIDAKGCFVSPGFIDCHIHGDPGELFSNESRHGTAAFIVAQSCASPGFIRKKIDKIKEFIASDPLGPNVLGVRLEGPYINKEMAGAQDRRFIKPPSAKNLLKIIKKSGGILKMITMAPELKGAAPLIKLCRRENVIPSIGHSNASYEEAKRAFSCGARHATHLSNAMSGPRHGSAGLSLAALFDRRITVEVITDLIHVKPELLKLLFAVKKKDKVILVTDSIRAKSSGHRTGSSLTMIKAVENVVKNCRVRLLDAINMASLNPAILFGAVRHKGAIAPGKDADIVIFDKEFDVKMTIIRGKIVYRTASDAVRSTKQSIARRTCAA